MSVSESCKKGRKGTTVSVDFGVGEYLHYSICAIKGARNDAIIVDDNEEVIVGESHQETAACRRREWAKTDAPLLGAHFHTLVVPFVRSLVYEFQVTLRNNDGSIKRWVRDCAYTADSHRDRKLFTLTITVK